MKSAALARTAQNRATTENLGSLFAKIEQTLKVALGLATATKLAKAAGTGAIKDMYDEIERLRKEIKHATIVVVQTQDQYMREALEAIVPKLPTLIENKRRELQEADIAYFVASVMPTDPLRDVLLDVENDNVALREQYVKSHICLDSKSVAKNAGNTSGNQSQTAWRWKNKGQIFAVDYFGKELYPAFQFRDGKPLDVIKKILDVFGKKMSPWQIAFWFDAENSRLDGERPVDLLNRGEQEVLECARWAVERAQY